MKKLFVSSVIIIILTNFIFCRNVFAGFQNGSSDEDAKKAFEDMSENSTANTKNGIMDISNISQSSSGSVVGLLVSLLNMFPLSLQLLSAVSISSLGVYEDNSVDDDSFLVTIQNIITGKYVFFDANVFSDLKTAKGFGSSVPESATVYRENVALWFTVVKDIAIIVDLIVLVYIAVRLALASVSTAKARYKEMLYNWVISLGIIFSLPYFMSAIGIINEFFVDIAIDVMNSMETDSFEKTIMVLLVNSIGVSSGFRTLYYSIMYWMLLWVEIKFIFTYAKRMLKSFFLVIISPLISVTYSIDKLGDNKAQAFSKWLKEYSLNLFMQPIHCLVYVMFMYMANNIAQRAPLVGILFLMSLEKAHKIIVTVLGVSMEQAGDQVSLKKLTGRLKGLVPTGAGGIMGGK